jgi:hypothetical protein
MSKKLQAELAKGKAAREKEIEKMRAECRPDCLDLFENRLRWGGVVTLCQFCKRPAGVDKTCDGCWEVTSRLADFLRDGGTAAQEVIKKALHDVLGDFEVRR